MYGIRKIYKNALISIVSFISIFPLITVIIWAFTERWVWPGLRPTKYSLRAFGQLGSDITDIVWLICSSSLISVTVALLSLIIAIMTARALILYDFKARKLIFFLSILPFLVPASVFAMGIHIPFIRLGLNNNIYGIIITHLIYSLPYVLRLVMDAMLLQGEAYEEQAMLLGASKAQILRLISIPLLLPSMLVGFCISYIVSFSQYFLTLLIGGGQVKTFTIVMLPYMQSGNRNIASAYSLVFIIFSISVFIVFDKVGKLIVKRSGICL